MRTTSRAATTAPQEIRGKVIEAEVKVIVDPARPLPLAEAVYAIEGPEGVWLCAYYGTNRSVFDYLPQKGAEVDERTLGLVFHTKHFVPKDHYQPARWEEFKQAHLSARAAR